MVLGLVIVAAGFFLGLFKRTTPASLAFCVVGYGLVIWFGLPQVIAGAGHLRALSGH